MSRPHSIYVRVSEEEREEIKAAAAREGEAAGTWARRKLLELARWRAPIDSGIVYESMRIRRKRGDR